MESEDASFSQRVFHIVAAIPYGKVTTYGEVARLAGSPRAARQVGGVLRRLPEGSSLPWHRVINRHGKISQQGEDFQRQRQALLGEGIVFGAHSTVDLLVYGWRW
ncbi:MAG: MGMT family protein [Serratia liquefaciens]|nr:MGMT family protein [Serratia liquefaciens]